MGWVSALCALPAAVESPTSPITSVSSAEHRSCSTALVKQQQLQKSPSDAADFHVIFFNFDFGLNVIGFEIRKEVGVGMALGLQALEGLCPVQKPELNPLFLRLDSFYIPH